MTRRSAVPRPPSIGMFRAYRQLQRLRKLVQQAERAHDVRRVISLGKSSPGITETTRGPRKFRPGGRDT
jgi:hypothetical protein